MITTPNPPPEDEIDPFLQTYNPNDLRIASEFLSNWLPFLSKGLCQHCTQLISDRVRSIHPGTLFFPPNKFHTLRFATGSCYFRYNKFVKFGEILF